MIRAVDIPAQTVALAPLGFHAMLMNDTRRAPVRRHADAHLADPNGETFAVPVAGWQRTCRRKKARLVLLGIPTRLEEDGARRCAGHRKCRGRCRNADRSRPYPLRPRCCSKSTKAKRCPTRWMFCRSIQSFFAKGFYASAVPPNRGTPSPHSDVRTGTLTVAVPVIGADREPAQVHLAQPPARSHRLRRAAGVNALHDERAPAFHRPPA